MADGAEGRAVLDGVAYREHRAGGGCGPISVRRVKKKSAKTVKMKIFWEE